MRDKATDGRTAQTGTANAADAVGALGAAGSRKARRLAAASAPGNAGFSGNASPSGNARSAGNAGSPNYAAVPDAPLPRREHKRRARELVRKRYWAYVIVCIVAAFFAGEFVQTFQLASMFDPETSSINSDVKQVIELQEEMADPDAQYGLDPDDYDELEEAYREAFPDSELSIDEEGNLVLGGDAKIGLKTTIAPGDSFDGTVFGILAENTQAGRSLVESMSNPTRGVLAGLTQTSLRNVHTISSSAIAVASFVFMGLTAQSWFALAGALLTLLLSVFVGNLVAVGERRWFLESRIYLETELLRVLFPYRNRSALHVAWVMLLRDLKLFAWALTLVMLPVKAVEYQMVPYILAERTDMPTKEVFRLAHEMTYGHRWQMFVFYVSFWYWFALSQFTLGLASMFYFNGYFRAAETEMFVDLRERAIARAVEPALLLNDRNLYASPDPSLGIYPGTVRHQLQTPIPIDYERTYSWLNLAIMFFVFAAFGWVFEVGQHLAEYGTFANRGTLHGPWLPIYGVGGLAILVLLKRFRDRPNVLFFATMGLCGALEYATGWALEALFDTRWWDYTGYLLNVNGYICLEGLLAFAIGGLLFVYVIGPMLDDLLNRLTPREKINALAVLVPLFGVDMVYSLIVPNVGSGVTDINA